MSNKRKKPQLYAKKINADKYGVSDNHVGKVIAKSFETLMKSC